MESSIPEISIIIPFYNEEEGLQTLCSSLGTFLPTLGVTVEVIFVNDGSSDASFQLLKNLNHTGYQGKIVSLSKNYGSHAALRAGMQHASANYISFMNADMQDPLELVGKLLAKMKEGFDITWAFRNNTQNSFLEKAFSKTYSSLMRKYAIPDYPVKGYDIVMFSRKVLNTLNSNIEANSSIHLQILTLGYSQTSVGYDKLQRKHGKSKWTIAKKIKLLVDSFVSFSYYPIRLVSVVGITFFIIGFIWTLYIVIRKLVYDDLATGFPALISVLLIGFGITNISLGIIAEYLWRTFDAARKRPVFIIDQTVEIKNGSQK